MGAWNLTRTFDFDGRQVRHDHWGQGPAIVLVHGTPWSSFNLRHLVRRLASDHTVYTFDLLGYGQSDKAAGDVSLAVQNRLLVRLLEHWGLECPLVIGHDFGGATVLRSHLLHPQPYAGIVLIDPVALAPWGSPFFQHVRAHEAAFAGVPAYIHEAIVRAYVQTAAQQPLDADTLHGILAPWSGPDGQGAFYRQIAQADERFTNEVQARYASIDTPVLILWGRQDTWIPLARGEALQAMIPGAVLRVIEDAGHLVIEEQPDALVREIRAFIGRH